MPVDRLETAVQELSYYFNLPDRDRLLRARLASDNQSSSVETEISNLILGNIDGFLTTNEIIEKLNSFSLGLDVSSADISEINNIIKVFALSGKKYEFAPDEQPTLAQVLNRPTKTQETKDETNLSIICLRHAKITPANKQTNALTLFFNSIPTIEFSRCIPFLEIGVQTKRSPVDASGRLNSLSALKFLLGAEKLEDGTADMSMARGLNTIQGNSTFSGMELFTMPQTLINANTTDNPSLRIAPVIDIFRPFMSIERLKLNVHQAGGLMLSYKSGELNLILHDRSRLAEIAELITPALFGQTEILLEYGWSHPDESGDNIFGQFLNSMRTKEKYQTTNCSYTFDDVGQVKINLKIAMKGATDYFTTSITEGEDDIVSAQKVVQKLNEEISELKNMIFIQEVRLAKEIRGLTILETASDLTIEPNIKKIRKELSLLKRKIGKSGSLKEGAELLEKLKELYGIDKGKTSDRGSFGDLKTKVAEAFNKKMNLISSVKEVKGKNLKEKIEAFDPFINLDENDLAHIIGKKVSLGKIFAIFIGDPLASSGRFDDIQIIFYNFNASSGATSNKNIAEFLIDVSNFKEKMGKLIFQRQTSNIPLWEFQEFITNQYIDQLLNENYGMSNNFVKRKNPETGEEQVVRLNEEGKEVFVGIEQIIDGIQTKDGTFKLPILDIFVETNPGASVFEGDLPASKTEKTILKIHIFDKQNSPYELQSDLLEASRNEILNTIGKFTNTDEDKNKSRKLFDDALAKAKRDGVIKPFGGANSDEGEQNFEINGGPEKLKQFLYETMPYIIYGNQNTAIETLGFGTIYESDLTSIMMLRAPEGGEFKPHGAEQGGTPLQMFPAQLNGRSLGCPILNFGQQLFIDLHTNTSCDNIYAIAELSHTIEPGRFMTEFRALPTDAYGKYRSLIKNIGVVINQLDSQAKEA